MTNAVMDAVVHAAVDDTACAAVDVATCAAVDAAARAAVDADMTVAASADDARQLPQQPPPSRSILDARDSQDTAGSDMASDAGSDMEPDASVDGADPAPTDAQQPGAAAVSAAGSAAAPDVADSHRSSVSAHSHEFPASWVSHSDACSQFHYRIFSQTAASAADTFA